MAQAESELLAQKISFKLKLYRRWNGFSQEETADKSGVSLRNYQRIESAQLIPKLDTLFTVLNALKASPEVFFMSEGRNDMPLLQMVSRSELKRLEELKEFTFEELDYYCELSEIFQANYFLHKDALFLKNIFTEVHSLSQWVSDPDYITHKNLDRQDFSLTKNRYRYEEYTSKDLAIYFWTEALKSRPEAMRFIVPVNYTGVIEYARVFAKVISFNADSPLMTGYRVNVTKQLKTKRILEEILLKKFGNIQSLGVQQ